MAERINVSLDPEYAEKLSRLAARMHVQEGTLAKSLLSTALDGADPDAAQIVAAARRRSPARCEGAHGRASRRRGAARAFPLDDLA